MAAKFRSHKILEFVIYYDKRPNICKPMATFLGKMIGQTSHEITGKESNAGTIRTILVNPNDHQLCQIANHIRNSTKLLIILVKSKDAIVIVKGDSCGGFVFTKGSSLKIQTTDIELNNPHSGGQHRLIRGLNSLVINSGQCLVVIGQSKAVITINSFDFIIKEALNSTVNSLSAQKTKDNSRVVSLITGNSVTRKQTDIQDINSDLPVYQSSGQYNAREGNDIKAYDFRPIPERLYPQGILEPIF